MTTEQRLADALDAARRYQPSPDLWGRVVHSIEEDRLHRRRIIVTVLAIAAMLAVAGVVAAAFVQSDQTGSLGVRRRIDWRALEALETGALVILFTTLGPALRRFGRGYVGDLLRRSTETASRLLALLDVAFYVTFSGYVLITMRFAPPHSYVLFRMGDQISETGIRIGGLLLAMGLLHAATLMAMPLVALVFNTTRTGGTLPRWATILLTIGGVLLALQLLPILGVVLGGTG